LKIYFQASTYFSIKALYSPKTFDPLCLWCWCVASVFFFLVLPACANSQLPVFCYGSEFLHFCVHLRIPMIWALDDVSESKRKNQRSMHLPKSPYESKRLHWIRRCCWRRRSFTVRDQRLTPQAGKEEELSSWR